MYLKMLNGFLPICITLPKTEVLSTVLQFHLRCRNWYWHSLMPVFAPSPMYCMWSWYKWHSFFCPWESPASWLQRGCAPMIYTSDIWTGLFIPSDLKRGGGDVHSRFTWTLEVGPLKACQQYIVLSTQMLFLSCLSSWQSMRRAS